MNVHDPREIVKARRRVEERYVGKDTQSLAMAAAVNTELLLDQAIDHETRLRALEKWRIALVAGFSAVLASIPILLAVIASGP